jgi:hypothetical protein
MSKADRAMLIVRSMTLKEQESFLLTFLRDARSQEKDIFPRRLELFDVIDGEFCMDCGGELPEEGPDAKPHACPMEPFCVCEHKAGEHDEEDEEHPCLVKGCKCEGFEDADEEEDEPEEAPPKRSVVRGVP